MADGDPSEENTGRASQGRTQGRAERGSCSSTLSTGASPACSLELRFPSWRQAPENIPQHVILKCIQWRYLLHLLCWNYTLMDNGKRKDRYKDEPSLVNVREWLTSTFLFPPSGLHLSFFFSFFSLKLLYVVASRWWWSKYAKQSHYSLWIVHTPNSVGIWMRWE